MFKRLDYIELQTSIGRIGAGLLGNLISLITLKRNQL